MKKIKYVWENQGFRHIHDGQCDEVKIIVTRGQVVLEYGNPWCVIKEKFDWISGENTVDEAFKSITPFQTSQDFGVFICDGHNETLSIDGNIVLSNAADTPVIKSFLQVIHRLVGFDVHEYTAKRFLLLHSSIEQVNF